MVTSDALGRQQTASQKQLVSKIVRGNIDAVVQQSLVSDHDSFVAGTPRSSSSHTGQNKERAGDQYDLAA